MSLSVGKIKRFQQLSDAGIFKIIAIDHAEVFLTYLKNSCKPSDLNSVREEKFDVIKSLRNDISGLLVDTKYVLPLGIIKEIIPGSLGFMVNYEGNNYYEQDFNKDYFIDGLSAKKIQEIGASALKLFFYYDPESENCSNQDSVIHNLGKECKDLSLPLLIEPILHPSINESRTHDEKVTLTYRMLERLSQYEIDIFKIAFPGNLDLFSKEENLEICRNISKMLSVPWVLLSSGKGIEEFIEQLKLGCDGGASGYIAGRTLWQDFVIGIDNRAELGQQMQDKVLMLNEIVEAKARKWTDIDGIFETNICQEEWFFD